MLVTLVVVMLSIPVGSGEPNKLHVYSDGFLEPWTDGGGVSRDLENGGPARLMLHKGSFWKLDIDVPLFGSPDVEFDIEGSCSGLSVQLVGRTQPFQIDCDSASSTPLSNGWTRTKIKGNRLSPRDDYLYGIYIIANKNVGWVSINNVNLTFAPREPIEVVEKPLKLIKTRTRSDVFHLELGLLAGIVLPISAESPILNSNIIVRIPLRRELILDLRSGIGYSSLEVVVPAALSHASLTTLSIPVLASMAWRFPLSGSEWNAYAQLGFGAVWISTKRVVENIVDRQSRLHWASMSIVGVERKMSIGWCMIESGLVMPFRTDKLGLAENLNVGGILLQIGYRL